MKTIKLNEDLKKDILEKMKVRVQNAKTVYDLQTLKVDIPENNSKDIEPPTVLYTPEAWLKMRQIVDCCPEEVQWHGLVKRTKNTFLVYDILMFPQIVTAAHCDTDDAEYAKWQKDKIQDMKFPIQDLRMHGHSHAKMGVYSSGTDDTYQHDMLTTISDYYIFAITNHAGAIMHLIYDLKNNILYERADVTSSISFDGQTPGDKWGAEMKKNLVKSPQEARTQIQKEQEKTQPEGDKKMIQIEQAWDFWDNLYTPPTPHSGQVNMQTYVNDVFNAMRGGAKHGSK